jgi:glycerol-3-phosphate acyltransferase PlsY
MIGHIFPVYYKFKGGKGVSCTAACILLLSPISFCILLALFLLIAASTKYISLGSIMCAMLFPLLAHAFGGPDAGFIPLVAFFIGALVVFMHRENIKRLLSGKESKFSLKKTNKHKAEEHDTAAAE